MNPSLWRQWLHPDRLSGAIALYLPAAAALCFWRIGATGMVAMEGMVADGGKHMLASGDWAVPRVFGEIYTYKPALAYWFAALAHAVADPPPTWLLRLPFAASALVMGLVVLVLLSRLANPRLAFLCSLVALSSGLFIRKVRLAEFDVILMAGVGVAIAAACCNLAAKRASATIWFLGYLGLTFGFLAKGVPALMNFGPGLIAAAWVTGSLRRLFDWRHLLAVGLFVALAGGYLFAAYRSVGSAAFEQPLAESKLRGLSWTVRQENTVLAADGEADVSASVGGALLKSLAKPLYVFGAFFPVSLLLPFAFVKTGGQARAPTQQTLLAGARAFLVAGIATYMVIPTHHMRYFLPLSAAVGILAGSVLVDRQLYGRRGQRRILMASAASAVLTTLALLVIGGSFETPPVSFASRAVLVALGAGLLWFTISSLRAARTNRAAVLLLLAVGGTLAAETLALQPRRAAKRDLAPQAIELGRFLPQEAPVWVLGPSDLAGKSSSLYYNLGRPIETFRPGVRLPPADSYCILVSDRLDELGDTPELVFDEITRVSDPWRTYLLGVCSGPPWPPN